MFPCYRQVQDILPAALDSQLAEDLPACPHLRNETAAIGGCVGNRIAANGISEGTSHPHPPDDAAFIHKRWGSSAPPSQTSHTLQTEASRSSQSQAKAKKSRPDQLLNHGHPRWAPGLVDDLETEYIRGR